MTVEAFVRIVFSCRNKTVLKESQRFSWVTAEALVASELERARETLVDAVEDLLLRKLNVLFLIDGVDAFQHANGGEGPAGAALALIAHRRQYAVMLAPISVLFARVDVFG